LNVTIASFGISPESGLPDLYAMAIFPQFSNDAPSPVVFAQRLEDELHNHFGLVSFVTGR